MSMVDRVLSLFLGSKHERDVKALLPILHSLNEKEPWAVALKQEDFPKATEALRERFRKGESLDSLMPEAFALAREAARRTLGERPYDVQMMGGVVLHQGKIVEMKTGEGKTLSCVPAAYLNAISGAGVHVVTVNDYLAERDADWMRPVFGYLGMTVGFVISQMDNDARRLSYGCDITYGTNNEFGFDYLRDNMRWDQAGRVQRGHNYCIVDEIDSILIDEARTPLIISGSAEDDTFKFSEVNKLVPQLKEVEKNPKTGEYPREEEGEELHGDYKLEEKNKRVIFTDEGMNHIEQLLMKRGLIKDSLFLEDNFEYIHYFTQATRANLMYHKDVDYVVQDGLVQIVDEFTGRILYGRRYSEGLHQAIEAKERIKIAARNQTLATITFQNYFRMYKKISGMTGTADTEANEFAKIYNLEVVVIPTNRPVARKDEDDVIYLNEDEKYEAIATEIAEAHKKGQPVLVGTISIEKSEKLSALLTRKGIRHEVLNAKNHAREALIIAEAGAKGSVTIATNMAGRGTDIKLGGNADFRARKRAGTEASPEDYKKAFDVEYLQWRKDAEEVKAAGGLYVIGTERHESRRIDNQLRGRSGRQGDPGRSRFFISLDDELMRLFGGENIKRLMGRIGMEPGEPIYHPMLNKAIANAQKKVEERNFEIRKHLLEYDDVLNEQRKFIYEQRDGILSETNLKERIAMTGEDIVEDLLDDFDEQAKREPALAYVTLQKFAKARLGIVLPPRSDARAPDRESLRKVLDDGLVADMAEKESLTGPENLNNYVRMQYLQAVDSKWLDHLENLEALRDAVYLRAYGQKNPLTEYKLEGFQIFDTMIDEIRTSIAERFFLIKIRRQEERAPEPQRPKVVVAAATASHGTMGQFDAGRSQERGETTPDAAQVRRTYAKVGRNDPCPCGSGKKYKYCHGKE